MIFMARKTIPAHDEIVDDVTGKPVDDKAETVKVSVNGKTSNLDMTPETLAVFTAFVSEPTDENRRNFGALLPRPRVGTSTGSTRSGNSAAKREWLRANGFPTIGDKGKFSADMDDAYAKHEAETAKANEPAA
jgi:hypothetical protein